VSGPYFPSSAIGVYPGFPVFCWFRLFCSARTDGEFSPKVATELFVGTYVLGAVTDSIIIFELQSYALLSTRSFVADNAFPTTMVPVDATAPLVFER